MGPRDGDPALSASFKFTGLEAIERRMNPQNTMDRIEAAVDDAAETGKQVMREAIETRGTGKTWKSPWFGRTGSYPGRVDQGDMLKDVIGRVTARTSTYVRGLVGWTKGSPLYYRLQNEGFRHVLTGESVEGMMALRDAGDAARRSLISNMEDIARSL